MRVRFLFKSVKNFLPNVIGKAVILYYTIHHITGYAYSIADMYVQIGKTFM